MQGVGGLRTEMSEYDIARIIHLQCPLAERPHEEGEDEVWEEGDAKKSEDMPAIAT